MRKLRKWVESHLGLLTTIFIGLMLTLQAIEYTTTQRGYKAYGGEYLILPLLLLIYVMVRELNEVWK